MFTCATPFPSRIFKRFKTKYSPLLYMQEEVTFNFLWCHAQFLTSRSFYSKKKKKSTIVFIKLTPS